MTTSPVGKGMLTSLPQENESELAMMLTVKAKWGFGSTRDEVRQLVHDYVVEAKTKDNPIEKHLKKYCQFKVSF